MRIPLATSIKTRTGVPDKDARLKNAYVEGKGDPQSPDYQSVVRKRPQAQGGIVTGSGIAQGGIGFSIAGVPYFIGVFGDAANGSALTGGSTAITPSGASVGTNWAAGTGYAAGQMVSVDFVDYWAINDNTGSQPPSSHWSRSFVPAIHGLWRSTRTSATRLSSSYFTATDMPDINGSMPSITYGATILVALQARNSIFPSFTASGATWNSLMPDSISINNNGYYQATGGGLDGIQRQAYSLTGTDVFL